MLVKYSEDTDKTTKFCSQFNITKKQTVRYAHAFFATKHASQFVLYSKLSTWHLTGIGCIKNQTYRSSCIGDNKKFNSFKCKIKDFHI